MIIGEELKTSFQLNSGFKNFRKTISLFISWMSKQLHKNELSIFFLVEMILESFVAFMGLHMYLRRECLDGMGGIIIVGRSLVKDCLKE